MFGHSPAPHCTLELSRVGGAERSKMGVDPRQVLAGVLTITMFVMLGDMIKRDHFDSQLPVRLSSFSLILIRISSTHALFTVRPNSIIFVQTLYLSREIRGICTDY